MSKHTAILAMAAGAICGCELLPLPAQPTPTPTGAVAAYVGSAACRQCHAGISQALDVHGHSQILKKVLAGPPRYPSILEFAGVLNPPPPLGWGDVSYVIGGYLKAANFVDAQGFLLQDGQGGEITYALERFASGTHAGFLPFDPAAITRVPYTYECFRCHTTGPQRVEENGGDRQGGLPGIGGTWAEDGVQCEACHGPGSLHAAAPSSENISVDATARLCARCHVDRDHPDELVARDGYVASNQQYTELQAGPHTGFGCGVCHDPHGSVAADRANSIRNSCQACHANQTMALHAGRRLVQVDYVETLTCESCHMPLASKQAVTASDAFVAGSEARIADTRTHIFRVSNRNGDYRTFLTPDGSRVALDEEGQAAVTLDYVCLRCHTGVGNAFRLDLDAAAIIADGIHESQ